MVNISELHSRGYNVPTATRTHTPFRSHLNLPMSGFIATVHVNHLILGEPVNHPPSLKSPQASAIRELSPICHFLPLQVWKTGRTQPVNRAVWHSGPSLWPNCRCNTQICPTLPNSCEPPPAQLSNPHSILKMGIYMPHTAESKQAHLKVHMLMCDI